MVKFIEETPDNVLSSADAAKIGQSIDSCYNGEKSVFDAIKNSCKRSRQNFKQLSKDLLGALLWKKKDKK